MIQDQVRRLRPILPDSQRTSVIHLKLLVMVHHIEIVSIGSEVVVGVGVGVDANGGLGMVMGREGGMIEV